MIDASPEPPDLAQARAFVADLGDQIISVRHAAQEAEGRARRARARGNVVSEEVATDQAENLRAELHNLQQLVYGLSKRFPEVLSLRRTGE